MESRRSGPCPRLTQAQTARYEAAAMEAMTRGWGPGWMKEAPARPVFAALRESQDEHAGALKGGALTSWKRGAIDQIKALKLGKFPVRGGALAAAPDAHYTRVIPQSGERVAGSTVPPPGPRNTASTGEARLGVAPAVPFGPAQTPSERMGSIMRVANARAYSYALDAAPESVNPLGQPRDLPSYRKPRPGMGIRADTNPLVATGHISDDEEPGLEQTVIFNIGGAEGQLEPMGVPPTRPSGRAWTYE